MFALIDLILTFVCVCILCSCVIFNLTSFWPLVTLGDIQCPLMFFWYQKTIAYIGQGYHIIIQARMWYLETFFKIDLFWPPLTSVNSNGFWGQNTFPYVCQGYHMSIHSTSGFQGIYIYIYEDHTGRRAFVTLFHFWDNWIFNI